MNATLQDLTELNPEALLADGLEAALVGYTVNHHHAHVAVYDVDKCIAVLMERDGMTHDEADEFISVNTLGAYVGENGPLFVKFAAILLLLASTALAGTTDDAVPDASYVAYGSDFAPYTRRLEVVETTGRVTYSTAVVIGGRHALTAAHVVQDYVAGLVDGNPVEAVTIHEDFERDGFWFDIAVLRVKDDFRLSYYPRLSDGGEQDGATVSIAGYGLHGPMSAGFGECDRRLRAGTQTIERFERTLIVCAARRGSSPMEFCISPGDSGGPLFVGSGPSARLAGINSCTMRAKGPLRSREGEESGHTRVALFRKWINEVVGCADE